ncbi:MAG: hypothetical protein AAFP16_07345 [Pseudomonadota bacterium]
MSFILVVSTASLLQDLTERKGRNNLEKQRHGQPRQALQQVLLRMSRDMEHRGGDIRHLRADHFEERPDILGRYPPNSFGDLLSKYAGHVDVPSASAHAAAQPHGYVAAFDYWRLNLSVLATYVEDTVGPALVLMNANRSDLIADRLRHLGRGHVAFDALLDTALAEVAVARS